MRKLTRHDIKDLQEYERERDAFRAEIISLKKRRRIALGDIITVVFENAATMRFQIQEMVFAEGISDHAAVQAELDTYNPLLPSSHELSATLFIEIPDMATLKAELPRLVGIENSVSLTVGESVIQATGEGGRSRSDYTSTVHYLRFRFDDDQRDDFRDPAVPVLLNVDHENYSESTPVTGDVRLSLIKDLALG